MRRSLAIARDDKKEGVGTTKRRLGMKVFFTCHGANARHPIRKPLNSSSNTFEHPYQGVEFGRKF